MSDYAVAGNSLGFTLQFHSGKRAMTFPVAVHPWRGQFQAALLGAPDVNATAPTREEALDALKTAIAKRLDGGELIAMEVGGKSLSGLFGKYRDDPALRDICDEAYKERDVDVSA
jgi:hypothetical protein